MLFAKSYMYIFFKQLLHDMGYFYGKYWWRTVNWKHTHNWMNIDLPDRQINTASLRDTYVHWV